MLMPSFCWPLVVGPKLAITRPFAGQRNFGNAPEPSADFPASAGASTTGVTTLALAAGSASCATAGAAAGPWAAVGLTGVALGLGAETRAPGMIRRSPTLSLAVACMLLALVISLTGLP